MKKIRVLGYTVEELIEMENFALEYGWTKPEYPTFVFPAEEEVKPHPWYCDKDGFIDWGMFV